MSLVAYSCVAITNWRQIEELQLEGIGNVERKSISKRKCFPFLDCLLFDIDGIEL